MKYRIEQTEKNAIVEIVDAEGFRYDYKELESFLSRRLSESEHVSMESDGEPQIKIFLVPTVARLCTYLHGIRNGFTVAEEISKGEIVETKYCNKCRRIRSNVDAEFCMLCGDTLETVEIDLKLLW